jgi:hypothetical protein
MNEYEPQTKFLATYYHRGARFGLEFYAADFADAEEICKAHSLALDGEHVMTIPTVSGTWFPNLIIRLRNWIQRTNGGL